MLGLAPALAYVFLIGAGFAHRQMGPEAEQWTATELAKLDRRRWRVIHDIQLSGENVDHVAIGPGRIYAIETKWTTAGTRFLNGSAEQAQRRAKKLATALSEHGAERRVIPLLVLWGPGIRQEMSEGPKLIGETRMVAGPFADDWLGRMNDAADHLGLDFDAYRALESVTRDGDTRSDW